MKILIDENLPRRLKERLSGHDAVTVQEGGWTGIKNSELLKRAEGSFDVVLTADKNLRHQQNLSQFNLAVIVFPSNRLGVVEAEAEHLQAVLATIQPRQIIEL